MRRFGIFLVAAAMLGAAIGVPLLGGGGAQGPVWREMGLMGGSIWASETNGASDSTVVELSTNGTTFYSVEFDYSQDNSAQIAAWLPRGYRNGTPIFVTVYWTSADTSTSETVEFDIYCKAVGDGDDLDGAWGSGVSVTDTNQGANKEQITAESSALTINNSPERGDKIVFKIEFDASGSTIDSNPRITEVKVRYMGE